MPRANRLPAKRPIPKPDALTALSPGASPLATRDRLLAMAGYDEAEQARMLRDAIEVCRAKLDATKVQRLVVRTSREREEVQAFEDQAHETQLRAATELISLVGGYPGKAQAGSGGPTAVKVVVNLAPMPGSAPPKPIEVQAKPAP